MERCGVFMVSGCVVVWGWCVWGVVCGGCVCVDVCGVCGVCMGVWWCVCV